MNIASQNKRCLNLLADMVCFMFVYLVVPNAFEWYFSLYFAYYIIFETLWQRTPGKFITGTKVIMEDGSNPHIINVIIRTFARLIPLEALTFLGSKNPVGWHDEFSKTRVIEIQTKQDAK